MTKYQRGTLHLSEEDRSNGSLSLHNVSIHRRRPRKDYSISHDKEEELNALLDKLDYSAEPANAEFFRPSPKTSTRRIKLF
jgi:hypothetical protein